MSTWELWEVWLIRSTWLNLSVRLLSPPNAAGAHVAKCAVRWIATRRHHQMIDAPKVFRCVCQRLLRSVQVWSGVDLVFDTLAPGDHVRLAIGFDYRQQMRREQTLSR